MTTVTEQADTARADLPPGKIVVVMPAYNAGKTLERTYGGIPAGWVDDVILVDDKSPDDTIEVARTLPLQVIWHPHNVGYGGNQKTCYLWALQHDADVVVMLHPDGQYEPTLIPKLVAPILRGEADLVLGSRLADGPRAALKGKMPLWKLIANRCLTVVENADPRHAHERDALRLPRLLAGVARQCAVSAQLARLLVRLRDAHAGVAHGLSTGGGADTNDLLRRRIIGGAQAVDRVRVQDPAGGRAADAPPVGDPAVAQVRAVR